MTIRMNQPSQFGYLVARLRQQHRLTQVELANRSGLSYGTIVAIECRPHADPRFSTLRQLASALNVSPIDLFMALDDPSHDATSEPALSMRLERDEQRAASMEPAHQCEE